MERRYWRILWIVAGAGVVIRGVEQAHALADGPRSAPLSHWIGAVMEVIFPLAIWLAVLTPIFCLLSNLGRKVDARQDAQAAEAALAAAEKRRAAAVAAEAEEVGLSDVQRELRRRIREAEAEAPVLAARRGYWVPMRLVLALVVPVVLLPAAVLGLFWLIRASSVR